MNSNDFIVRNKRSSISTDPKVLVIANRRPSLNTAQRHSPVARIPVSSTAVPHLAGTDRIDAGQQFQPVRDELGLEVIVGCQEWQADQHGR